MAVTRVTKTLIRQRSINGMQSSMYGEYPYDEWSATCHERSPDV
jgi:hypothetical protein